MKEGERERRRRFDALFEAYRSDMVAYCTWRAGTPSDAEEAVAEIFLTAWRLFGRRTSGRCRAGVPVRDRAEGGREPTPIDALGRVDREVLLLAEWEGLSPAQIASVLRCSNVTARGRLHRSRRRFRAIFEQLAAGEGGGRRKRLASELPATSATHVLGGESGTTPSEILDAVREDVGGATLRRIVRAMTASGLTTGKGSDSATVYSGTVPAGQIATEAGFKEGQPIPVFPFGYVAHDEAADPSSPLDTAVTVGSGGVIRAIAVTWGTWTYTVTYGGLGSTPAPAAPANAKSLRELRRIPTKR